jgi:hypothetical protein
MVRKSQRKSLSLLFRAALVTNFVLQGTAETGYGYTLDSPEVKEAVKKATAYLEGVSHEDAGGASLIGMALLKTGRDVTHPKVQEAIRKAQELAAEARQTGTIKHHTYSEAIACIFLSEADPERYQSEINSLITALVNHQRPNGCWSYKQYSYDDTSQTQYGMLALWSAHSAGVSAPVGSVERAMGWLMRTQSRDGGFSYNPSDPGSGQMQGTGSSTLSMSSAGLGSVYVGAHLLGIGVHAKGKAKKDEPSLPPALTRVNAKKENTGEFQPLRARTAIGGAVQRSMSAGNAWFNKNFAAENSDRRWTYYYLYGLERYKSFKEVVEGKQEAEPAWYNAGVEYLLKNQRDDGTWNAGMCGSACDTAFGVLFLIRGTKKAIKKAVHSEGVLIGGHGLPKDLANVRMDGGQVVTPQMVREVDDFMKLIEDAEDKEFDATALPGELSLDEDLTKRTSQLEQLRELVSNEDWRARRTAVKTLAAARDLDNVPILIYALTDEDSEVPKYARDGLRFISRKLEGFGMPDNANEQQTQAAVKQWKEWYLSIRPDGEFVD